MSRITSAARFFLPVAALLLLGGFLGAPRVSAAGVVGNGTPGSCTEPAFESALVGGGAVTFNCGPNPVTINISAQKSISLNTKINGGNKITLSAGNTIHFQVYSNTVLALKNIKLSDGNGSVTGSIENFGTLKANNVTFFKNAANGDGGAISNRGKLVVKNSFFIKNTATASGVDDGNGGAVWNGTQDATAKFTNTTFKSNKGLSGSSKGGAIANAEDSADLVVIASKFIKNQANIGGAIWTENNSTNSVLGSSFTKNKADMGAAIGNQGGMEIVSSTFNLGTATDQGGALWQGGSLSIDTSTFSGNSAQNGGAVRDFGASFFIQRSTFNGNHASNNGGAVYSTGDAVEVQNVTFSGNTATGLGGAWYTSQGAARFDFVTFQQNGGAAGGAVYADEGSTSTITLRNSVVSLSVGGGCGGDEILSDGNNVSSDGNCGGAFVQPSDKNNKNTNLGPLANNGGATRTHLPLTPSPLINKGFNDPGILIDQRGLTRPVGPKSDIGAVEVQ